MKKERMMKERYTLNMKTLTSIIWDIHNMYIGGIYKIILIFFLCENA